MTESKPSLSEIFKLFLKIGLLGFGGPYALLSYLEKEIVERKKWLPSETFWEGVAIGQITPGPIFFATAVFCGFRLRGVLGGAIAAFGCTFPAFILTIVLGYLYMSLQALPQFQSVLLFLLAVVAGLLLSVLWKDRAKFFKTPLQQGVGVVAFCLLLFFHLNPLLILLLAGVTGAFFFTPAKNQ